MRAVMRRAWVKAELSRQLLGHVWVERADVHFHSAPFPTNQPTNITRFRPTSTNMSSRLFCARTGFCSGPSVQGKVNETFHRQEAFFPSKPKDPSTHQFFSPSNRLLMPAACSVSITLASTQDIFLKANPLQIFFLRRLQSIA